MKIEQEKIKGCQDSLFYDGKIASIGKYVLIASGDIEIRKEKNGDLVFGRGTRCVDGFMPEKDEDLSPKNFEKLGYYWEHNNWFEVIDGKTGECILGDVVLTYDEGIELLKRYHKEKIYDK